MPIRLIITLLACLIVMAGCATPAQQAVALKMEAVGGQAGRIGVAMAPLPERDTVTPGADCLLCYAAASMMNSTLTKHARTLPIEDLARLKTELAEVLRKKGSTVTVIEADLDLKALPDRAGAEQNFARKDFSALSQKYGLDRLLVVDITALGFVRTYSSYVPTSDPKARLAGTGYIVDLKSHAYDWYQPVTVIKSAEQAWDEPPNFPGLTNAYFQALELGKDGFLQPFAGEAAPALAASQAAPR